MNESLKPHHYIFTFLGIPIYYGMTQFSRKRKKTETTTTRVAQSHTDYGPHPHVSRLWSHLATAKAEPNIL